LQPLAKPWQQVVKIATGFDSVVDGNLLLLKLVTIPASTINKGNIQGCLKNIVVKIVDAKNMTVVILLFTESLKFPKKEYNKKPIVIGLINLKSERLKPSCALELIRKDKQPIKIQAGKIQINKVIRERKKPPRL
jgi:hypothetical protein